MAANKDYLVFIDTNVFLNFYRAKDRAGLSVLGHLDAIADRIITTEQVEMEYKKNRQKVIYDSEAAIKVPEQINLPVFLMDARNVKGLKKSLDDSIGRAKKIKSRLKEVIAQPKKFDTVYKAAEKIFSSDSKYNLKRGHFFRYCVRYLANKRFTLGYPPRKGDDITIGDAINWEWIISCSKVSHKHIIIVSTDTDYGLGSDRQRYVNDWLLEEFRERTSRKRQLVLTSFLADALKLLNIKVGKREEAKERELIQSLAEQNSRIAEDFKTALERVYFRNAASHGETAPKSFLVNLLHRADTLSTKESPDTRDSQAKGNRQ